MRKSFLFFCLLLFAISSFAENIPESRLLTGKVTSNNGEELIGVNVVEKGGKAAAVTDFSGDFSLSIPAGKSIILSVSYMGYQTKELSIKNETKIQVVLEEDVLALDEMVVIGYGTQKKSSLTSSIETIKSTDILQMPTPNLDQALSGQVAGLGVMAYSGDPSTAKEAKISIRGISEAPLLVIDGVPRFGVNSTDSETRLSDINPDDIENISILKDAAAAAVYGARAARGVILVTTKRGTDDRKTRVNYRGQFNLQNATQFPEFLNAYEFAKLFNQAVANSPSTTYLPYSSEELEDIRLKRKPNLYGDENLLNYLNTYGYSTTHSLSVSGGSKTLRYYTSLGYTQTQGLYSGVGRERYNYSVKLDANIFAPLTLSVDLVGSQSNSKNTSYTSLDAAYNYSPLQALRYTDGHLTSIDGGNPLVAIQGLGGYIKNGSSINTISSTLKYDFQNIKGLSLYIKGTYDNSNTHAKNFSNPVALYKISEEGAIESDENTIYPKAKPRVEKREQFSKNILVEAGLNYNRTFAAKHNVGGLLVVNKQEREFQLLKVEDNDLSGSFPELIGSGRPAKASDDEFFTERASLIGRVSYGFDYRYFFETSFRVDASTKFHPDNRTQFFPSVSGSWVASNERFFKNWHQRTISNLKMRASVGLLGDDGATTDFSYLSRYIFAGRSGYNIDGKLQPGIILSPDDLPNKNLEMEKRYSYNLAADVGFWDNKIGISGEYYLRYRTNMLQRVPVYLYPPSTGADGRTPYVNMGKVKEWGWDLTVNHKNSIGNFKYNFDFTLSKSENIYLDYGDESTLSPYRQRKGKSFLNWQLYEADGLFQSFDEIANHPIDQDKHGNTTLAPGDIKYKDLNGDNMITPEDMKYVKNSSNPDYSFSLKLGANYKGFFANIMFQGVAGYRQEVAEIYSLRNRSLQRFQTYHRDDTWSEDNPNANFPRLKFADSTDNNRKASTFWLRDCDFIRLKSVTLGYSFSKKMIAPLKISSLTASIQGGNLFTWSTLNGMDPESLRGYPIQRTFGASLSAGF